MNLTVKLPSFGFGYKEKSCKAFSLTPSVEQISKLHALIEPPSRLNPSATVNVQVPVEFSPLNADKGLSGVKVPEIPAGFGPGLHIKVEPESSKVANTLIFPF